MGGGKPPKTFFFLTIQYLLDTLKNVENKTLFSKNFSKPQSFLKKTFLITVR